MDKKAIMPTTQRACTLRLRGAKKDDESWRDALWAIHEAVAFLKRHLNIRSEIRGVNREDIYEIPLEALREAVVNALMHRDYSIRGTSAVGVAPRRSRDYERPSFQSMPTSEEIRSVGISGARKRARAANAATVGTVPRIATPVVLHGRLRRNSVEGGLTRKDLRGIP